MRAPRGLSESETAAWAQVAATVKPFRTAKSSHAVARDAAIPLASPDRPKLKPEKRAAQRSFQQAPSGTLRPEKAKNSGLDSHWDRRLRAGYLAPDFTLDLHEHSLDAAYERLLGGLDLAREAGARLVLLIAGRERPGPAADRAHQRGAIRSKLLDWLAASRHADAIAAIRPAQRQHGGHGALYVILRKGR